MQLTHYLENHKIRFMEIDMDTVHFIRNRQTLGAGWFLHSQIPNPFTRPYVRRFGLGSVSDRPRRCIEVELHVIRLD